MNMLARRRGPALALLAVAVTAMTLLTSPWPANAAQPAEPSGPGVRVTVSAGSMSITNATIVSSTNKDGVHVIVFQAKTKSKASLAVPPWQCALSSYDPTKSGSTVSVKAGLTCKGTGYQPIQACDIVQRHRWWGWENVGAGHCSGWGYVSSTSAVDTFNCAGTGTYNYMGAANGYADAGGFDSGEVDSPNQPRWSC